MNAFTRFVLGSYHLPIYKEFPFLDIGPNPEKPKVFNLVFINPRKGLICAIAVPGPT